MRSFDHNWAILMELRDSFVSLVAGYSHSQETCKSFITVTGLQYIKEGRENKKKQVRSQKFYTCVHSYVQ